jgi:hypothetical protein
MKRLKGAEDYDFLIIKVKNDDRVGIAGLPPSINDWKLSK